MTGVSTNPIELSIIVPVLNEIEALPKFIAHLKQNWNPVHELLIVDGGSTDGSWEWLETHLKKGVCQTVAGRAYQMNFGAQMASKKWLYFVHIDSQLPKNFDLHITQAVNKGTQSGCFRLKFDHANWLLRRAAAGSRWNHPLCRGGDQSLFISKVAFTTLGGYDTRFVVCEDINLIKKLYATSSFSVLPEQIQTSSRRFYENGVLRLLIHFGVLHLSHWLGAGPHFLKNYHLRFVR